MDNKQLLLPERKTPQRRIGRENGTKARGQQQREAPRIFGLKGKIWHHHSVGVVDCFDDSEDEFEQVVLVVECFPNILCISHHTNGVQHETEPWAKITICFVLFLPLDTLRPVRPLSRPPGMPPPASALHALCIGSAPFDSPPAKESLHRAKRSTRAVLPPSPFLGRCSGWLYPQVKQS